MIKKVPLTTSVATKKGRSSSGSSSSSSSKTRRSMAKATRSLHMNNFTGQHVTKEYNLSVSTEGRKRDEQVTTRRDKPATGNREHAHEKDRSDQSVFEVAENFSPPRVCRRARLTRLRGGWSLDDSAMCPVAGRTWDLSNPQEQKKKSLEFVLQEQA